MAQVSYKDLSLNGLWKNNPAIVQLLGLCPLLAVTGSVVNAIGLGLATTMVLIISNTSVSLIRNIVSDAVRLPAFVMIIAAAVTCIELLMQAFAYELFQILGIFLPLITTNCVILGRADGFAAKNSLGPSMYDGFIMGVGFAAVLILLGGMRELTRHRRIVRQYGFAVWRRTPPSGKSCVFKDYQPFLLAILPPGAFIFTGLIIAVKNLIDDRIKKRQDALKAAPVKGAKRVRVTGTAS